MPLILGLIVNNEKEEICYVLVSQKDKVRNNSDLFVNLTLLSVDIARSSVSIAKGTESRGAVFNSLPV